MPTDHEPPTTLASILSDLASIDRELEIDRQYIEAKQIRRNKLKSTITTLLRQLPINGVAVVRGTPGSESLSLWTLIDGEPVQLPWDDAGSMTMACTAHVGVAVNATSKPGDVPAGQPTDASGIDEPVMPLSRILDLARLGRFELPKSNNGEPTRKCREYCLCPRCIEIKEGMSPFVDRPKSAVIG